MLWKYNTCDFAKKFMTRELVFIQTGQCGNQLGWNFWEAAVAEHAAQRIKSKTNPVYDANLNVLFQNFDRDTESRMPLGSGISSLRARAVLVDTEPRVIDSIRGSSIGSLFSSDHILQDASGSGNNWATGFVQYGDKHRSCITDMVRMQLEACDCCEGFVQLNSIGGGTGSGLGSWIVEMLSEEFPKTQKICAAIFPSQTDDVITSPYNALFSTAYYSEYADVVIPFDNTALIKASDPMALYDSERGRFDSINAPVSRLILGMTSSLRFGGKMHAYPSDIIASLLVTPSQKFLLPFLAPLGPISKDNRTHSRSFQQAFADIYLPKHHLLSVDVRKGKILRAGYFARGAFPTDEVLGNVGKIKKINTCTDFQQLVTLSEYCQAPFSLAALINSDRTASLLLGILQQFRTLFARKAHVHHYTQYVEKNTFLEAAERVIAQIHEYSPAPT